MSSDEKATSDRHAQRMARKKEVVDAAIARAQERRGLLLVLTGNGKGKSSSALGMLARVLGHGMSGAMFRFIKGDTNTGEEKFFISQPSVIWENCGAGFTWETQNRDIDIAAAAAGWAKAKAALADPQIDLVILDELTYVLNYTYLDTDEVLATIKARPLMQHVVVTGRAAPQALLELADTVSEIADVKHAFRAGVVAQEGIDL